MATGERLYERAVRKISNPALTEDDVYEYLNIGFLTAAERLLFPGLQMRGTVTTSITDNSVAVPTNFHCGLYDAYLGTAAGAPRLQVIGSLKSMIDLSGAYYRAAGEPSMVCAVDPLIYFSRITSVATVVVLHYHRKPADITSSTTRLDGVPLVALTRVEQAILHYAAYLANEDMEIDPGVPKVETNHHLTAFESIIEDVRATMPGVSRPGPVRVEFGGGLS